MDTSQIINEWGEDREHYFNAMAPPIMQTSNFVFRKVDDLSKAFADEMSSYIYSRGVNPTVDILRKKLAALEGSEDCLVFNSGAAACFAAVLANVKAGDHIGSVANPYSWTQRLFEKVLPRFGVNTTFVDGREPENYYEVTTADTRLYYLESPNTWDYALQDIAAIATFAKGGNITTVLDNSYCTSLYQQPILMGIDISLQTATKYIGGHSDTLGGVLCGTRDMMRKIFASEYLTIGSGIQPFNAWLLIRGLRTLPARLAAIAASTQQLVDYLKQHSAVESVLFPFDSSFPQYELAKKQMKGAGGLFTFVLKTKKRESIVRVCESLQHIVMGVSWGGHESLVMPRCAAIAEKDFDPDDPLHRSIRMYVGLETVAYLRADLEQALKEVEC
jgi:cystathionine beta-lyase/cystathionine gamma-synthase